MYVRYPGGDGKPEARRGGQGWHCTCRSHQPADDTEDPFWTIYKWEKPASTQGQDLRHQQLGVG